MKTAAFSVGCELAGQSTANSQITSVMESFAVTISKGGTRLAVCHRLTAINTHSHFRIANKPEVHGTGRKTAQGRANFAQRSQSRSLGSDDHDLLAVSQH